MLPEIKNSIEGSEGKVGEIIQRSEQKRKEKREISQQNAKEQSKDLQVSIWRGKEKVLYKVQKSEQFFTSSYNESNQAAASKC